LYRWRGSLRAQLLLQTALAVGIVLIALVYISAQALNASTQQILEERKVTAEVLAERFDSQLDHAMAMLESAVADITLLPEGGSPEPDRRLAQGAFGHSVFFNRVDLLDAAGRVLAVAPYENHLMGVDMTVQPYNLPITHATRPVFLPVTDPETKNVGVALALPIRGASGSIVGYLVGWIDLSDPDASSLFEPREFGGAYTDLVDAQGTVVVSSRSARIGQSADHTGRFSTLIRNGQATVGKCHSCHDPQGTGRQQEVLAFAPVGHVPWGVALRQSEDEVFAPVRALSTQLAGIGLVVMAVFLGFAWVAARSIILPLRALTQSCQDIASGNLSRPVPVTGATEVRDLGHSFEGMRHALGDYRDQVDAFRHDLEHRVKERTAELEQARDQLLKTNSNLTALSEVAAILSQSLNLAETLNGALERALEAVGAEIGGIYLPAPEDGNLILAAHRGLPPESVAQIQRLPSREDQPNPDPIAASLWQSAWRGYLSATLKLPTLLCIPLEARGQVQGVLFAAMGREDAFAPEDRTLFASIGWQMALTVRNARLYDDLQREERARAGLLHRVIAAQEDERKRIARELHDETSQALTALMIGLDSASADLTAHPREAAARLSADKAIARQMLVNMQRLIGDLRPSLLDDLGLVPAIIWYGEQRFKQLGVDFRLETHGLERRLPPDVETALFRIVQEAMNNIARHAEASAVAVSVEFRRNCVSLLVADDGQGFDPNTLRSPGAPGRGHGLLGIQERVSILEGEFRVDTGAGQGTIITVRVPMLYNRGTTDDDNPRTSG
jgi:signal transduction histidine kinase